MLLLINMYLLVALVLYDRIIFAVLVAVVDVPLDSYLLPLILMTGSGIMVCKCQSSLKKADKANNVIFCGRFLKSGRWQRRTVFARLRDDFGWQVRFL